MKRTIPILLSLLLFWSCNKSDDSSPNPVGGNPSLNSTEQKLLGTWNLKKEADTTIVFGSIDTMQTRVYTSFPQNLYVTFKSSVTGVASSGGPNAKDMDDGAYLSVMSVSGAGRSTGSTLVTQGYWYYNTSNARLTLQASSIEILTLTNSNLILRVPFVDNGTVKTFYTLYFEK